MKDKILSTLNEKQAEAVKKPLGPVLVIAGPGTGKTHLLTSRIAWLITAARIAPEKILALTFTNKAARELKNRLIDLVGAPGKDVFAGTFHGFALGILRKYHERAGLKQFFSVCDQEYQQQLVLNLCTPYIKDDLQNKVQGILLSFSNHRIKQKPLPPFTAERYAEYLAHLEKHNLIDFDQIIDYCRNLLQQNKDVLEEYRFLYPAILIDEFQDTDPVQYDIVKMLGKGHRNIFAVADDDQSIYSWRGADPENIKRYISDFSIANPVFLEINYRNGDKILSNAQRVISRTNRLEPGKQLRVFTETNNSLEMKFFYSESDEIEFVLSKIQEWTDNKIEYKDIALIYPFHKIGHALEHFLLRKQIPYQMASGRSFLDHPLILRLVLYLRLIRDPGDTISLEDLARVELGEALFGVLKQIAADDRSTFRTVLYGFYASNSRKLPYDNLFKIRNFIGHIANLVNLKSFFSFRRLFDEIYVQIDQPEISILYRLKNNLESFDAFDKHPHFHRAIKQALHLYVYHPDKRIATLGCQMVKKIINKPVDAVYETGNFEGMPADAVMLALSPGSPPTEPDKVVPVYTFESAARKAGLSHLYKLLQWYVSFDADDPYSRYIVLDLETTDAETGSCGIVEIAALRVENGRITEEFHSLVNPQKQISKSAQKVHQISAETVQNAPPIEKIWTDFTRFIGSDILIAHNGYHFDFPILDRYAKQISGHKLANTRIDTLVIARNLYPAESNSVDALMHRFSLSATLRHRAMADVHVLVDIFNNLQKVRYEIGRAVSLEMLLDYVALGNYLEDRINLAEDRSYFISGARKLKTAYSESMRIYLEMTGDDEIGFRAQLHEKIHEFDPDLNIYKSDEYVLEKIKDIAALYEHIEFNEAISDFLSIISLNMGQDQLENINAISLLTYHSAKGLEFDKVVLMGMEDKNMPGFHALKEDSDDDRPVSVKKEEQRRLFYVGMTRAKSELILTAVKNRGGWEHKSSEFLRDLKI